VYGQKKQYVILVPGGFKPPTGGHYSMIKQYDEKSDVIKVFVVTGRGGATERAQVVSLEQSQQIFKVYGGFSDKVEFIEAQDATPLTTCYKLMENPKFVNRFPNAYFSIGAGNKGKDPQRIEEFVSYFMNNEGLTDAKIRYYLPAKAHMVRGKPASASRMRKAYTEGDWDLFKELLPHPDLHDNVVRILSGQAEGPVNENFLLAVPRSFLVEGKKANPWAICTAQVGRENKKKYESCVKQVKKKHNISEELGEDGVAVAQGTEQTKMPPEEQKVADAEKIKKLIKYANNMVRQVVGALEVESDLGSEAQEAIVAAITDMLTKAKDEDTKRKESGEESMVAEMSGMAAGAVAGHAGAWNIGEDEDESKRRTAS
jgi:hypothetical protein